MPGPDLAVAYVVQEAENRLRAYLSVAGDALDAADVGDCLHIGSWALAAGSPAPLSPVPAVVRATPAQHGTTAVTVYLLDLDAPVDQGAGYTLALTSAARAWAGQATSTAGVAFVAGRVVSLPTKASQKPADIAFPLVADATGDLSTLGIVDALEQRLRGRVSTLVGGFDFSELANFGNPIFPKRNYSIGKQQQLRAAVEADLKRDPDVKAVRVELSSPTTHLARLDIVVQPRNTPRPLRINVPLIAGEKGSP